MKEGKLELELLKELLSLSGYNNEGIITKGEIGRDTACIDISLAIATTQRLYEINSDCILVVKSDPITFPTPEPGRYAVIVNANDIGCAGAVPFGFLATIIAPPSIKYDQLKTIQRQIHETCRELRISVLGGHTEVSSSVNSVIVSGHMFGFVPKDYYVPNKLVLGDKVVQIGYAGAEGTGIILAEAGDMVTDILSDEEIEEGIEIGSKIHVLGKSLLINKMFQPNLIHDATEGGIFGALYEIIAYHDVGLRIDSEPIMSSSTKKLAKWLNIDPYRLISSGTLLVFLPKEKAERLCNEFKEKNIPCKVIGEVIKEPGKVIYKGEAIEKPVSDEIVVALEKIGEMKSGQ